MKLGIAKRLGLMPWGRRWCASPHIAELRPLVNFMRFLVAVIALGSPLSLLIFALRTSEKDKLEIAKRVGLSPWGCRWCASPHIAGLRSLKNFTRFIGGLSPWGRRWRASTNMAELRSLGTKRRRFLVDVIALGSPLVRVHKNCRASCDRSRVSWARGRFRSTGVSFSRPPGPRYTV